MPPAMLIKAAESARTKNIAIIKTKDQQKIYKHAQKTFYQFYRNSRCRCCTR